MTILRAPRRAARLVPGRPVVRAAAGAGLLGLVFVVSVGAVLSPIAFAALVGAAFIGVLGWMRPKTALAATFIVAVLSPQLQAAAGPLGVLDEAFIFGTFVVITVRRALMERSLVWLPGLGWFALFGFAGLLGAIIGETPMSIAAQGAVLLLKCVVFAFTLAQTHWRVEDLHRLAKAGMVFAVALIVTGVLNLALPGVWNSIFGGSRGEYYGGIPAIIGPFRQPAAYGRLAVILAASILVYQLFVRSSVFGYLVSLTLGGLSLLTFRVKALVGLAVVSAGIVLRSRRWLLLAALAGVLPAAAVIAGPSLYIYIFGDIALYYGQESARSRMTTGGFQLAREHFPLGVGFGRYGSATAAEYYSPEYYHLGFERVYGLAPGEGRGAFLNDTQWPALLGETGWLGTGAFIVGVILALRTLLRATHGDEPPLVRWIRLSGVAWMVLILLDSVAAPVFSSPPSFLFLFAGAAIVASIRFDLRDGRLVFEPRAPGARRLT